LPSAPPTDPYVKISLIRFVSTRFPAGDLSSTPLRRMTRCCPGAIPASFVDTGFVLKVTPVFPSPGGHARLRLPAAFQLISWVPWASVPHASGTSSSQTPSPRYCALLRLPSSFPAGSRFAPDRYLGLTHSLLCPLRRAPGWVRSPFASYGERPGVVLAAHPLCGFCSQGDGRLSRVPGLPL
jgi:hypothetical protein